MKVLLLIMMMTLGLCRGRVSWTNQSVEQTTPEAVFPLSSPGEVAANRTTTVLFRASWGLMLLDFVMPESRILNSPVILIHCTNGLLLEVVDHDEWVECNYVNETAIQCHDKGDNYVWKDSSWNTPSPSRVDYVSEKTSCQHCVWFFEYPPPCLLSPQMASS